MDPQDQLVRDAADTVRKACMTRPFKIKLKGMAKAIETLTKLNPDCGALVGYDATRLHGSAGARLVSTQITGGLAKLKHLKLMRRLPNGRHRTRLRSASCVYGSASISAIPGRSGVRYLFAGATVSCQRRRRRTTCW